MGVLIPYPTSVVCLLVYPGVSNLNTVCVCMYVCMKNILSCVACIYYATVARARTFGALIFACQVCVCVCVCVRVRRCHSITASACMNSCHSSLMLLAGSDKTVTLWDMGAGVCIVYGCVYHVPAHCAHCYSCAGFCVSVYIPTPSHTILHHEYNLSGLCVHTPIH